MPPEQIAYLCASQAAADTHTDGKVGQLLTLAAALGTLVVAGTTRTHGVAWMWVLIPLGATACLCLEYFGVRKYVWADLRLKPDDIPKPIWALDAWVSFLSNEKRRETRVEIYHAAQRWLFVALVLSSTIGVLQLGRNAETDDLTQALEHVRAKGIDISIRAPGADSILLELRGLRVAAESLATRSSTARSRGGATGESGSSVHRDGH